jgi:hypothetical protein
MIKAKGIIIKFDIPSIINLNNLLQENSNKSKYSYFLEDKLLEKSVDSTR